MSRNIVKVVLFLIAVFLAYKVWDSIAGEIRYQEEVARIEGYDCVPENIPISAIPVQRSPRERMVRIVTESCVAAGFCEEVLVQVSYAIGVVEPIGIFLDTYGTCPFNLTDSEIAEKVSEIFDMRPAAIEERLKLRQPMYSETAAYGHMGRKNEIVEKTFYQPNGDSQTLNIELFTWEKLDYIDKVKTAFGL